MELYDEIGIGYTNLRKPDPRIAHSIEQVLDEYTNIVNVGAGTGSYEPNRQNVIAVEPSLTMISQRPANAAPVIQASASKLPFKDCTFDISMAILTVHHWPDYTQGLVELARSTKSKIVILTWDPSSDGYWLTQEYFPDIINIDRDIFPDINMFNHILDKVTIHPVLIPYDCTDGFLGAYWRRPEAYLSSEVRRSISSFSKIDNVGSRIERLRNDLKSGKWHRKYGYLLKKESLDLGYRLIVAG